MKKLVPVLICVFISVSLAAQQKENLYQVSGKITEKSSGNGIPYATVILKKDSTDQKKMVACDAAGRFTLTVDTLQSYTLTVTAVGFKELSMPVQLSGTKTDIGTVSLEEGIELKAVTVTAQKPLVRIEVDKLVYSMESDPEAQATNALEMMSKVPMITVDAEENIRLNGQTNFKVLVNGKSSSMMNSNLKEVLKSMPASTIKNIEVITNPSSKYDAEGVGGIINIITNRKTVNGFNGSVGAGISTRGDLNGSLYLATKINKFSFSGRFYGSQYSEPKSKTSTTSEYYNNQDYHYSNAAGDRKYKGMSSGFSGEASYEFDSLNLLSLAFWGYLGAYNSTSAMNTDYRNTTDEITRQYTSSMKNKNGYGYISGNIDYQKTYKKPDKSLTFSYKLEDHPSTSEYKNNVTGLVGFPSYYQRSENDASGREHTFQTDYYDPLTKKHQIEGGLKFILRQNVSESETWRDTVKLLTGNDLDYDQYILGLYAGYVFKLEKFSTKAGLRMERTWNDGVSKNFGKNTTFDNRLFNLVPYITFTYMPKEGRTYHASYTQRLSRPGIWYLNPYVNDVDSMNISYGNPSLDAEISHSFELGYSFFSPKLNITLNASGDFVNNSIENITKIQPNGGKISTYANIGKNDRYAIDANINYRPSPKFSVYADWSVSYTKLQAVTDYAIKNDGFSFNGYMGARWTAWKNGTVSLNAGAFTSYIGLQSKSSSYYYTGLGISQYLFKRKLMISSFVSDPFWKEKSYSYDYSDITFYSHSKYSYLSRQLRISLTYNFGKMDLQVKKARRGIQNDDLKGGSGNQGGGGNAPSN
ncbi:MAG TPA: TonB-dependent receptor [Bacteroidales bacterium]|nr:TonB-dependent receptor [Bacteroidales bacterium]